jgi:hypothetical protein
MLMAKHVAGEGIWRVAEVNSAEIPHMVTSGDNLSPRITIGCTLEEVLLSDIRGDTALLAEEGEPKLGIEELLALYANEKYVLGWCASERRAYVALKEGVANEAVLRAVWQAAWLDHQCCQPAQGNEAGGCLLRESHATLCAQWDDERSHQMKVQVEGEGWNLAGSFLVPAMCFQVTNSVTNKNE